MIIKTYKLLGEFVQNMNKREINLLIIESRGGLGKSFSVSSVLDNPLIFKGHATPLQVYMTLYKNPYRLVVFDDVDAYLNNKSAVAILKQMTDTQEVKTLYYSTSVKYDGQPVPPCFTTTCRVVLLCNQLKQKDSNLKAVLTRGFHIKFKPSPLEVFNQLKTFAKDTEILNYLYEKLSFIKNFNFRVYELCLQLKLSGMSWKNYLNKEFINDFETEILKDLLKLPPKKRGTVWMEKTNKSVRTMQRKLNKFKKSQPKKKHSK